MKYRGLRGSEFESMINRTIDDFRVKKLALIQKIPTPITPIKQNSEGQITLAYFEKKSTVDYIGVVQEIPVCFDAKECNELVFPKRNIHAHQYEFMKEWEEQGGISFLLIYFRNVKKGYFMRFLELDKLWKSKKSSFSFEELDKEYFIDLKGKLKIDFLP